MRNDVGQADDVDPIRRGAELAAEMTDTVKIAVELSDGLEFIPAVEP